MTDARILIAGVGNIFMGDDAFGVEVAQRLLRRRLPKAVRVVDFGIRGIDLAYALSDEHEAVILVDAACRGGPPGTLYVIEPEREPPGYVSRESAHADLIDLYDLEPAKVLALAQRLGAKTAKLLLIACEPQPLPDDASAPFGLSQPVQAAVNEAVRLVEATVAGLMGNRRGSIPRTPRPAKVAARQRREQHNSISRPKREGGEGGRSQTTSHSLPTT
ncbi:MAG: hydrogenase maturation protease [Planctomycetaceae bacterium]|nr:hydrogenase maturation protease [Planctomycetaceae bacterium]